MTDFHKLPHFTGRPGKAARPFPIGKLGWVQLTAAGGHPGNDLAHAAVRRWTAPRDMTVAVGGSLVHEHDAGDGVRGLLVSSRHGLLKSASVHNSQAEMNIESITVQAGDTLDFAADIGGTLNNDQFLWEVTITPVADGKPAAEDRTAWNSRTNFQGPRTRQLTPWEQLAQVLLSANEFVFID